MTEPATIEHALSPCADVAWTLDDDGFDPLREGSRESRFAISNGFLGMRGARAINRGAHAAEAPRMFIAGLFDSFGAERPIPALVTGPDWLRVHISLADGPASRQPLDMSLHRRKLDMSRGALHTGCRLSSGPATAIDLCSVRLVSLHERSIGQQLIRLDIGHGDADITLEASFADLDFGIVPEMVEQDFGVWRTRHFATRLAIAAGVSLKVDGQGLAPTRLGKFAWRWSWKSHLGQVVRFERTVAVSRTDVPAPDAGKEALARLGRARSLGLGGIVAAHEAAWAQRWSCSQVEVDGDPAAQAALRFAVYHLNGAANPADEHVSIAARALTGDDYRGHVFWDTEIFLLPFFTLTWPEAARALLMYRFNTLDAARGKAARLGWRGAFYAWESAGDGAETTPEHAVGPDRKVVAILCGTQEQHISADVAHATWHYWHATGDDGFLRDAGAEILFETARFWASRAQPEADGARHIRGVIGPDEYHEHIDDNAFTNVMARWNIRRALDVAALLRERWPDCWASLASRLGLDDGELAQWRDAAATIATGLDPKNGLCQQFDGYFDLEPIDLTAYAGRSVPMDVVLGRARTARSQVIKQADVVALLALLPDEFAGDTGGANFDYYEPRCAHGSSLSRAMHGLAAARLGRSALALEYFRQTAAIDLADTHAAIDGGLHIASLGGVWQIAVLGFAGLSSRDGLVSLDPKLPPGWHSLGFAFQWRGRHLRVRIDQAENRLEATLEAGPPMALLVRGERHQLRQDEPLRVAIG